MPNISVVQPVEMSVNFLFDTIEKKWKINNSSLISSDSDNILVLEDEKLKVSRSNIKLYRLIQDNAARKILLYQFNANESFDVSTAQLINEIGRAHV